MTEEERKRKREYNRKWMRSWASANREVARLRCKTWRRNHAGQMNVKAKARYAANPEPAKIRARAYQASHRERVNEKARKWRLKNRERRNRWMKEWRARNPLERIRMSMYGANRRARMARVLCDITPAQWEEIKTAYGRRCAYCGDQLRALTQDHVIPLSKGGSHTASNIVPACKPCNSRKGTGKPPPRIISLDL